MQAERDLLPGRRYPIARLQQRYGGRDLFETVFNFNHFHVYDQLDRLESVSIDEPSVFEYTNFPLVANFQKGAGSGLLQFALSYNLAVVTQRQAHTLADYYVRALEAMVAAPEADLHETTLLSDEDSVTLLDQWARGPQLAVAGNTVPGLIAERAAVDPAAIAVVAGDRRLSYALLEECGEQIGPFPARQGSSGRLAGGDLPAA